MRLSLIVAMTEDRVIGKDGQIPWHLSEDLKRFKRLTMGHPIIMGRKTHASIGRLLPGRPNLILSRTVDHIAGAQVFSSLDAALAALEGQCDEAFVIGGEAVYRQALPRADRIYLTLIHRRYEGDTHFPPIPEGQFTEVSREDHTQPTPHSYIVLERKGGGGSEP